MKRLKEARRVRGFTLIETAISLAITGFALVSIMGMLPVGLTNFRLARQATFYAEMIQTLESQVQATSFSLSLQKTGVTISPLYFDGEGNPLSTSAGAVYIASVVNNSNSSNPDATVAQAVANDYSNSNALNNKIQGTGPNGPNLVYMSLELTYVPSGQVLQQYPYFVGNNGS